MMFWRVLLTSAAAVALAGLVFLLTRFRRFSFIRRLGSRHWSLPWLASCLPLMALALVFCRINEVTFIVVMIHLAVIWLLCDIAAFVWRKLSKKSFSYDIQNWCALALTALLLVVGWYNAHHVSRTAYTIETEKDIRPDGLRFVLLADSHLGLTLDGAGFAELTERMAAEEPDAVFIVGDFTDDSSGREDMLAACEALGALKTNCGVYYVYGNHDNGYRNYRAFTPQELRAALRENGVIIIEDDVLDIGGRFTLIGRRDRSVSGRKDMETLSEALDPALYAVVLDHQPNDYDNEAAVPVDLVLSGHTHGGHLFPIGPISVWMGLNDSWYGVQRRGNVTFVVTSGVSGWAIPFKTGTHSEYVVIDVVRAE